MNRFLGGSVVWEDCLEEADCEEGWDVENRGEAQQPGSMPL
jgi:hypothetical protein